MNLFSLFTNLLVTPSKPAPRIDATALSNLQPSPSNGFRLRSYTQNSYGRSYSRGLSGRYTR